MSYKDFNVVYDEVIDLIKFKFNNLSKYDECTFPLMFKYFVEELVNTLEFYKKENFKESNIDSIIEKIKIRFEVFKKE